MVRAVLKIFIVASLLLTWTVSSTAAQAPDGTVKMTGQSIAAGVGFSWGSGATMKNQNGVVMNVVATTQGLMFKLGVDGMKVELSK